MPEEVLETGLNAPPEPDLPPPAADAPPPVAATPEPPKEETVPVPVLLSERRARQDAERRAERLEAELQAARNPPKPVVDIPDVSDDQAEKFARRYELYTPNGLDLARAKQMIADNRKETEEVARRAAEQVIEPLRRTTATQASKDNFLWAAQQTDANGDPLVDPKALAEVWATFPPELAANPEVAKVILKATVGEQVMSRAAKPVTRRLDREPALSEPPGGQRGGGYTISNVEKKVAQSLGIKDTDWESRAKTYQPGAPNRLE